MLLTYDMYPSVLFGGTSLAGGTIQHNEVVFGIV